MLSLRERAEQLNSNQPAIMVGKEKGVNGEIINKIVTINDYDFLKDKQGKEYAVYTLKEIPTTYFFGGVVITARLRQLHDEGYQSEIKNEGLPMLLTQFRTKDNRICFNVEFYPKENPEA